MLTFYMYFNAGNITLDKIGTHHKHVQVCLKYPKRRGGGSHTIILHTTSHFRILSCTVWMEPVYIYSLHLFGNHMKIVYAG